MANVNGQDAVNIV